VRLVCSRSLVFESGGASDSLSNQQLGGSNVCNRNKAALIFGAAQGIGRAVAPEFARRGARLAIADINEAGAEETAAFIAAAAGKATALACDVTSEQSVRDAARQAEDRLGPVDILMNNVGVILDGNPEDIPTSEWRRIMTSISSPRFMAFRRSCPK
jgi:NAD(P)-dependent dehydrogenase (short-subunit alcohol dehydrogenase family)